MQLPPVNMSPARVLHFLLLVGATALLQEPVGSLLVWQLGEVMEGKWLLKWLLASYAVTWVNNTFVLPIVESTERAGAARSAARGQCDARKKKKG